MRSSQGQIRLDHHIRKGVQGFVLQAVEPVGLACQPHCTLKKKNLSVCQCSLMRTTLMSLCESIKVHSGLQGHGNVRLELSICRLSFIDPVFPGHEIEPSQKSLSLGTSVVFKEAINLIFAISLDQTIYSMLLDPTAASILERLTDFDYGPV